MNDLKFHRFLDRAVKATYIHQSIHIVECLLVSMKAATTEIDGDSLQLALAMYALYLKPFDALVRNHPSYDEYESTYEKAVRCLLESELECPCSVCEANEE